MPDDDEPKEAASGCYQWQCRFCGARGVFDSYGEAKAEADQHKQEFGRDHNSDIWQCD